MWTEKSKNVLLSKNLFSDFYWNDLIFYVASFFYLNPDRLWSQYFTSARHFIELWKFFCNKNYLTKHYHIDERIYFIRGAFRKNSVAKGGVGGEGKSIIINPPLSVPGLIKNNTEAVHNLFKSELYVVGARSGFRHKIKWLPPAPLPIFISARGEDYNIILDSSS